MSDPATGAAAWFQADNQIVLEGDGFDILRGRGRTLLALSTAAWDAKRHVALARRYKVDCVHLNEMSFGRRKSADFLLNLRRPLRELHISLNEPKDLSALAKFTTLEYLGLMGGVMRRDGAGDAQPRPVDFSPLTKLREIYFELCPVTESLTRCPALEKVWVWNMDFQKSTQLDLSRLANLRELHVTACPRIRDLDLSHSPRVRKIHLEAVPKLQRLTLHPRTKLKSLKIGGVGAYRIDWKRFGPDLEELEIVGPVRYPLTDVLQARGLRVLHTNGIRTFPPLKFLLKLPKLREFADVSMSTSGPNWSEDDWKIYRRINQRGEPKR